MADNNLKPGILPWKCTNCRAKLGLLDAGRSILTIKVKDVYVWVNGGDVSMTCRNCGSINTLEQEPEQKLLSDRSLPGTNETK